MNIRRILAVLKNEGFDARARWANDNSGQEVGVRVRDTFDLWVVGLVPIDDESDMRFVDFLESKARKTPDELKDDYALINKRDEAFIVALEP